MAGRQRSEGGRSPTDCSDHWLSSCLSEKPEGDARQEETNDLTEFLRLL